MADSRDGDIRTQAQRALSDSPIFDLRNLQVDYVDGALLLSGRVETFYHKQLAQEVVRTVMRHAARQTPLVNDVDVEYVEQGELV